MVLKNICLVQRQYVTKERSLTIQGGSNIFSLQPFIIYGDMASKNKKWDLKIGIVFVDSVIGEMHAGVGDVLPRRGDILLSAHSH